MSRPDSLRRVARRSGAPELLRSAARALGYDLIRRHYYSPIPDLQALSPEVWTRVSDLPGVSFDIEAGLRFVEDELQSLMAEFTPPLAPTGEPRDFHVGNDFFGAVDATLLFGMVRRFEPQRVIELGSGMSTLVIAAARAANQTSGESDHRVFDPYPRADLTDAFREVAELDRIGTADVPQSEFDKLASGDLLFVDTTHTVKIGGDVNRIVLDILPRLAPGVVVHVHDIFLPWEYPREFLEDRRFFWAEQYLLQAFLAFNDSYEVLVAAHAIARRYPDRVASFVRHPELGARPGSLWLRRTAAQPRTA